MPRIEGTLDVTKGANRSHPKRVPNRLGQPNRNGMEFIMVGSFGVHGDEAL